MYIGITTFKERFRSHFIPLMQDLSGMNVIVAVNASNGKGLDNDYRRDMLKFLADHDNVSPIFYQEMRGLAKMWNDLVVHSPTSHILILNDDLRVSNAKALMDRVYQISTTHANMFTLNGSWSHFVTSRKTMMELNWFDERLLGFGEEDGDMMYRHIEAYGFMPPSFECPHIHNVSSDVRDNGVKPGVAKYSLFNRAFAGFCEHDIPTLPKKYSPDRNGIQAMFNVPMKAQIENKTQYPYEEFFDAYKGYL